MRCSNYYMKNVTISLNKINKKTCSKSLEEQNHGEITA